MGLKTCQALGNGVWAGFAAPIGIIIDIIRVDIIS